jgi:hypothetical protein
MVQVNQSVTRNDLPYSRGHSPYIMRSRHDVKTMNSSSSGSNVSTNTSNPDTKSSGIATSSTSSKDGGDDHGDGDGHGPVDAFLPSFVVGDVHDNVRRTSAGALDNIAGW